MNDLLTKLRAGIEKLTSRLPQKGINIMEVCGTHTVNIHRSGIKSILPDAIRLISGPGCPVCVTSQSYIDTAISLASRDDVIIATYGDMMKVPGKGSSLAEAKAGGADVRVVYSATGALDIAQANAAKNVVFLAVGFETTTPATAFAVKEAEAHGIDNFLILSAHKQIIPAMEALLADENTNIDAFLCPGHVSVIIGSEAYASIARTHATPCVVAGFDEIQILSGIYTLLELYTSERRSSVVNVYPQCVDARGNTRAQALINEVFRSDDAAWRGIGVIPASGLALRKRYAAHDAAQVLEVAFAAEEEIPGCRCGDVIKGIFEPHECPLFANTCTPLAPVGPCMVSSEGSCHAYYKYAKTQKVKK